MHTNNTDDFMNVVHIAEEYQVKQITVLAFKPDFKHELKTFPTSEQMHSISSIIKTYRGNVTIAVESCFSQLLMLVREYPFLGNLNTGPQKGCRAGLYNYSISVDGKYSPCRHIDKYESFDSLDEYLVRSDIITQIKEVEQHREEPCLNCKSKQYCRPCLAVNSKLNNSIYIGNSICLLWQEKG